MKQVEMFGFVLGKLLEKLFGMKDTNEILEATNQTFAKELNLNINDLCSMNIDLLLNNEKINNANLEGIADVLYYILKYSDTKEKTLLATKCLDIYEYLTISENTYSFQRDQKIDYLIKSNLIKFNKRIYA